MKAEGFTAEGAEFAEGRDDLTRRIIGCAIEVHRALGPGLLESAYEACLAAEFTHCGIPFVRQQPIPIVYRQERLDCGYRLDFVVDQRVIVELKAVETLAPIHEAQLISYLRLTGINIGLLINFNNVRLIDGVKRLVHQHHG